MQSLGSVSTAYDKAIRSPFASLDLPNSVRDHLCVARIEDLLARPTACVSIFMWPAFA